jgi:PST family polysaccharide transporter
VVLALLAIIMLTLPAMHEHRGLLGWTLLAAAARGASPLWYFQGVERAPRAMGIDAGARIIGAFAVLPFVTNPGHGWRVIAAQAIVNTVAAVWLTIEMARAHPFSRTGFAEAARDARRQSRSLYTQRIAMTLFLNANPVILGFFAPWAPLAAYASAERLLRSLNNILAPLSQVLIPRASALEVANPNAAGSYAKFLLPRVTGLTLVIATTIVAAAPLIVRVVLGPQYSEAIPMLRWFAPLLPIVAASTVINSSWAIPTGRDLLVLWTTVAAAVTLLVISVVAVPQGGATAMVWATLAAELVVLILLSVPLWRRTP